MTRERALEAHRLLMRVESLEMQLEEVDNIPVNFANRVSNTKDNKYPLLYETAIEIYDIEDIIGIKNLIQSKLTRVLKELDKL